MRYEYDFVSLPLRYLHGQVDESAYQEVIRRKASHGWRLVQVLVEQPAAVATHYQLIFERPAPETASPPSNGHGADPG